jgi:SAM-dependent methyltransferase
MDQPGLDRSRHIHALRGLERINRWSGSGRILWPPLRDLARQNGRAPLRVLDVASGGGDIPIGLWRKARRAGLPLLIDGGDLSPQAVEYARQRALADGADLRFFQLDALGGPLPDGYDVVICSLFLHHLDEEQAPGLLRHMARAAGRMVLVNDLRRTLIGFVLAYFGTRLLSTSEVVHTDGPRSVEGAFTLDEVRRMAWQAGLEGATVAKCWPCRFLLTWRRP